MGTAARSSKKSSGLASRVAGAVICVSNANYPVSLEVRKIYEYLDPKPLDPPSRIRVIDESGEDYLYPKGMFCPVSVPQTVREALSLS